MVKLQNPTIFQNEWLSNGISNGQAMADLTYQRWSIAWLKASLSTGQATVNKTHQGLSIAWLKASIPTGQATADMTPDKTVYSPRVIDSVAQSEYSDGPSNGRHDSG